MGKKTYKNGKVVNGALIEKKMEELGINQTELGEIIGARRATISLWKLGKTRSVSPKFRRMLCDVLRIKEEDLEINLDFSAEEPKKQLEVVTI